MGLDRLTALWTRVRDSLWFLPTLFTFGAVLLATATVRLDLAGVFAIAPPSEAAGPDDGPGIMRIVFAGTAEGARSVLNAIAAGLITVTGVVFSVTIVAIQLASTQFTPRILRNFTADRGNQLVLGVFIGTFTYALLVQRVVRGESDEIGGFVPNLSVTVALVLAVVSIAFLIFFIDHAARSVQAAVIIERVTGDALRTISRTLPDELGAAVEDDPPPALPEEAGSVVVARSSGYVQGVDEDALMDLLGEEGLTVRLEPHVGDFVTAGGRLATVWPPDPDPDSGISEKIRDAFILGHERTPHLDPEFPVVELVDIAVKALSPGINDPTTARICLDRLGQIIVAYGRRPPPRGVLRDPKNGGVLIVPRPEFRHLVDTALGQIRHFGAGNPHFAGTVLRRIAEMGRLLPPERHPPLRRHAEALLREALARQPEESDARALRDQAAETLRVLGGTGA